MHVFDGFVAYFELVGQDTVWALSCQTALVSILRQS